MSSDDPHQRVVILSARASQKLIDRVEKDGSSFTADEFLDFLQCYFLAAGELVCTRLPENVPSSAWRAIWELLWPSEQWVQRLTVAIESGQNFRAGVPRKLFEGPYAAPHPGRQTFDVSLDGQRFLMIKSTAPGGGAEQPKIIVVENWLEELQRLASAD